MRTNEALGTDALELNPAITAFLHDAEERGSVAAAELEALHVEHDLDEEAARGASRCPRGRGRRDRGGPTTRSWSSTFARRHRRGTTDSLPALSERDRPPRAADRRRGGRAREADRAWRQRRQGADDEREPAPGRLDRQALPGPRPAAARPDPGRHDRPQPRGREVRLPEGLQVLDVRDVVDPPVLPACGREPVRHDPDPGPRAGAPAEAAARYAAARGQARPSADDRGAGEGDRAEAAPRRGGARRCRGVGFAEPDDRRRRRRARRSLRRPHR